MKRERLEDLGRIYEKLRTIDEIFEELHLEDSKHNLDSFTERWCRGEDSFPELHSKLRWLMREIGKIHELAQGDEE